MASNNNITCNDTKVTQSSEAGLITRWEHR